MISRKTSFSTEELIGDLCAPEGTPLWCAAVRARLQDLLKQHTQEHEEIETWNRSFMQYEGWLQIKDRKGQPFRTYTDFCKAKKPFGLGRQPEDIDRIIQEGKARSKRQEAAARLAETAEAAAQPGGQPGNDNAKKSTENEPDNYSESSGSSAAQPQYGNEASTRVARLKRDHPEIAARLAAKEFKSVAAAERAAKGQDPDPPRKECPALQRAKNAYERLAPEDKQAFLSWLHSSGGQTA